MKVKLNATLIFCWAGILLCLAFVLLVGRDAIIYARVSHFTSAPFWLYVLVDAIMALLPAALCFLLSAISARKAKAVEKQSVR